MFEDIHDSHAHNCTILPIIFYSVQSPIDGLSQKCHLFFLYYFDSFSINMGTVPRINNLHFIGVYVQMNIYSTINTFRWSGSSMVTSVCCTEGDASVCLYSTEGDAALC